MMDHRFLVFLSLFTRVSVQLMTRYTKHGARPPGCAEEATPEQQRPITCAHRVRKTGSQAIMKHGNQNDRTPIPMCPSRRPRSDEANGRAAQNVVFPSVREGTSLFPEWRENTIVWRRMIGGCSRIYKRGRFDAYELMASCAVRIVRRHLHTEEVISRRRSSPLP
jgi:hypothetical protein